MFGAVREPDGTFLPVRGDDDYVHRPATHRCGGWASITSGFQRTGVPRQRSASVQVSIVTSVPIGVYGQISAEAASGSSTQPRLCGVPNDARSKLCSASPPLK